MKSILVLISRNMLFVLVALSAAVMVFAVFRSQQQAAAPQPRAAALAQPAAAPQPARAPNLARGSKLATMHQFHDFGSISMGAGKVSYTYLVRNAAATPVTINSVYTSCMCTEATVVTADGKLGPFGMAGHGYLRPISEVLPSGESVRVDVVFDPAAHGPAGVGPTERVVSVKTSGGETLELGFAANVRP